MPDRYEQKRDELVKGGMPYAKAQAAKEPVVEKSAKKEAKAQAAKA